MQFCGVCPSLSLLDFGLHYNMHVRKVICGEDFITGFAESPIFKISVDILLIIGVIFTIVIITILVIKIQSCFQGPFCSFLERLGERTLGTRLIKNVIIYHFTLLFKSKYIPHWCNNNNNNNNNLSSFPSPLGRPWERGCPVILRMGHHS